MTQLSPTALEEAAKAIYETWARNRNIDETWFEVCHVQHPIANEARQEATAAITAYLAQAEKEGWVMVPLNPNYDMGEAGMAKFASFHDEYPAACVDEIYRAMIANRPLAAAQNGGE